MRDKFNPQRKYLLRKRQIGIVALAPPVRARDNGAMLIEDIHGRPLHLADLLRFYADAGVDEALGEDAIDRFAEAAATVARSRPAQKEERRPPPQLNQPSVAVSRPAPAISLPDEAQAARARDLAREAKTLDELKEVLTAFDGCNLKFTAKQMVFADGNPNAGLMVIGEAPGRDEDLEGLPFVGRSGALLDRMLAAIGYDRRNTYIANIVTWRPPGNRAPTALELEICRPFIERQVELANPKVLLTLGGPPAKVLLNAPEGILRMRGTWKTHRTQSGVEIPAMPTLHPKYLLQNPAHKKLAWRDLLEIKARLESPTA
jgi:uracil-DNA glycosylase family 4